MKNKFLNICIGMGILFLTGGFFIRSINVAHAAPSPKEFIEEGTSKIGKYQIAFTAASNGDYLKAIIIDTETGKTTYYAKDDAYRDWDKNAHQIPFGN